MFEKAKLLWRLWSFSEEVQTMDGKALVKIAVAAIVGFVGSLGTAFLVDGEIAGDFLPAVWAALGMAGTYLKQSPVAPPSA